MVKTEINIHKNWENHDIVTDTIVKEFKDRMGVSNYEVSPIPTNEICDFLLSNSEYREILPNKIMDDLKKEGIDIVFWYCISIDGTDKKIILSTKTGKKISYDDESDYDSEDSDREER